jgi:hypothetical protein
MQEVETYAKRTEVLQDLRVFECLKNWLKGLLLEERLGDIRIFGHHDQLVIESRIFLCLREGLREKFSDVLM